MASVKEKLILGSAGRKHDDAITLDVEKETNPDVVHDLNKTPLPFPDNQFKEIVCHHVLEHLNELSAVMNELHRICKPDGTIYIELPHYSSWFANAPEHKLRFGYFSFDGYVDGARSWRKEKKFKIIKREVTFHRAHRRFLLHKLFNKYPMAYERFWTYIFPAEHLKFWLQPNK